MRMSLGVVALATLSFMVAACGREPSRSEEKRSSETSAAVPQQGESGPAHADASVKPGSYEDWCEEHGVPESMCTRCNAELVAAFKATGDWCEEHGLPESQCLQCNPKLVIIRPPKSEGQ